MSKTIEEAIQELKIVKQSVDTNDVEVTTEHEVCGSHTRYAES